MRPAREGRGKGPYPQQARGAPRFQRPWRSPKAPHTAALEGFNARSRDLGPLGPAPPQLNLRFHRSGAGCGSSFSAAAPPGPSSAGPEAKLSPRRTPRRAGRQQGRPGEQSKHGSEALLPSEAISAVATGRLQAPRVPTGPQGSASRRLGTASRQEGSAAACTLHPDPTRGRAKIRLGRANAASPCGTEPGHPPQKKNKASPRAPGLRTLAGGPGRKEIRGASWAKAPPGAPRAPFLGDFCQLWNRHSHVFGVGAGS